MRENPELEGKFKDHDLFDKNYFSSLGSRTLYFTEDMETIPFRRRASVSHEDYHYHERENEGFYGTPGASHRHRNKGPRQENSFRQQSGSDSDSHHRRRSHSHAHSSRSHHRTRDEGAYIMENPLYMAY